MQKFLPYKITHTDLSSHDNLTAPATNNDGSYIIIWWKNIVLGDFLIEPRQTTGKTSFCKMVIDAILPVVEFYGSKVELNYNWRNFLTRNSVTDWKIKMEEIFNPLLIKAVPKSVPVSVVICTHNRASHLSQCLSSLTKSICLPEEIIVVDNAPVNNDTKEVVRQFPEAKYIVESKLGLDNARNTGISEAGCSIVAFTDDDVEVHPSWVYRIWETFQNSSIAAMTGLVFAAALDTEAQLIFEKYWSFNRGYIDKIYDKRYFTASLPKGAPVWEIGAGANMAFRKSVFEEVGYFHELLDVGAAGCNGDSEMWFRILAKGNIIQYNPRAITYHAHRKNINDLKKQIFSYMRGCTTALLWQHKQEPNSGYKRNLLLMLVSYAAMIVKNFPRYKERNKTIWVEIKGVISGIKYYYKKENRSLFSIEK